MKILKTKKIVVKKKQKNTDDSEDNIINLQTIKESLTDINLDLYNKIGIIPIYGSTIPVSEYKKNTLYINVTRLLLKEKMFYYSMLNDSKKDIYENLDSIFNIKKNDINKLSIIKINQNKTLVYICYIKDFNAVLEGFSWVSIIDAYNPNSNKFPFNLNIYFSILNNEYNFNYHLEKLLYSNNHENQIKISDIYKCLV